MKQQSDPVSEWRPTFLGCIRNFLIEILLYIKFFCKVKHSSKLIAFPSNTPAKNPASLLRAYNIAEGLNKENHWFALAIPPSLTLSQRRRILRIIDPDILLIQMARHPLNRPALYSAKKIVFDIDDADYLWPNTNDIVSTCCVEADHVIAGSRAIANWVRQYNQFVTVIWKSAPLNLPKIRNITPHQLRKNVVAWGHSRPQDYLAESDFIQSVLVDVSKVIEIEYWVFGVNNEYTKNLVGNKLTNTNIVVKTFPTMSFDAFVKTMNDVSVGIQVLDNTSEYSQAKSFGKILGYILAGVVVVASKAGEHPQFFDGKKWCSST